MFELIITVAFRHCEASFSVAVFYRFCEGARIGGTESLCCNLHPDTALSLPVGHHATVCPLAKRHKPSRQIRGEGRLAADAESSAVQPPSACWSIPEAIRRNVRQALLFFYLDRSGHPVEDSDCEHSRHDLGEQDSPEVGADPVDRQCKQHEQDSDSAGKQI